MAENFTPKTSKKTKFHIRTNFFKRTLLDKTETELKNIKQQKPPNQISSTNPQKLHATLQADAINNWFDGSINKCREYINNLNNSQEKLSKLSPQYVLPENLAQYQRRIDNLNRRCDELEDSGEDYLEGLKLEADEIKDIERKLQECTRLLGENTLESVRRANELAGDLERRLQCE